MIGVMVHCSTHHGSICSVAFRLRFASTNLNQAFLLAVPLVGVFLPELVWGLRVIGVIFPCVERSNYSLIRY